MIRDYDFDFIIIGAGFGGSVAAHRLTEKGYRVAVLEMGKRYRPQDFPKTNWNAPKFVWAPQWGLHGFFRMSLFRHVWVVSGVGVGGGSLAYANVLLAPPDTIWADPRWAHLKEWQRIMPPFYEEAKRMLGVTTNPYLGQADRLLHQAAARHGHGSTFYAADVGVYFGQAGQTAPDPYFGGAGPDRTGCVLCGGCMIGCRYGAKNTLDQNYLYLAEKNGARIIPEMKVTGLRPLTGRADGGDGYEVQAESSTRLWFKQRRRYRSRGVIFAAGVLGTVELLLRLKQNGSLPHLSDQVGRYVGTNSETIIGVRLRDRGIDVSEGLAIGSGLYLDAQTHVEIFRYPKGATAFAPLALPLRLGPAGLLRRMLTVLQVANPVGFATSTVNLLVMQTLDGHLTMRLEPAGRPPFARKLVTDGPRLPVSIPQATTFARQMGRQFKGTPLIALTEALFNVPSTAHILGGAVLGARPQEGVVDSEGRVFNYKNMYICDGSIIGANLGVNPALTITALAEHIMAAIEPAAKQGA